MNKIYKILIIVPIIISGCKTTETYKKLIGQSIDNINLNVYSNEGEKMFVIKSPNSIYSNENKTFKLKETTINLYKDNQTKYIITSDKSQLSNNNKLLELKGNVFVKTLIQDGDKLYANSFTWNIINSEYLLVGNVKFENNSITLRSNKANLIDDNNIIEFFNPVKYKIKDNNDKTTFETSSENAYYNINTKSLIFGSKGKRKVRSKLYF